MVSTNSSTGQVEDMFEKNLAQATDSQQWTRRANQQYFHLVI
jgi:hypothetical protein